MSKRQARILGNLYHCAISMDHCRGVLWRVTVHTPLFLQSSSRRNFRFFFLGGRGEGSRVSMSVWSED